MDLMPSQNQTLGHLHSPASLMNPVLHVTEGEKHAAGNGGHETDTMAHAFPRRTT